MKEHAAAGLAACRGISTPCAKSLLTGFSFSCIDDAADPQPQMTRRATAQRHVFASHTPRRRFGEQKLVKGRGVRNAFIYVLTPFTMLLTPVSGLCWIGTEDIVCYVCNKI